MNLTSELLRYTKYTAESENNYEVHVQASLLDYFAVTFAGLVDAVHKSSMQNHLRKLISQGPAMRALVYGASAHRLELDDGYRLGGIHIGASVISALMAIDANASWSALKRAIVSGYEATGILAYNMQPGHKQQGFHSSGTCGCIGAAVAAGYASGLNDGGLKRAVSCAVGMASGLLEMQEDGSQLKPLTVGHAALNGVVATSLGATELFYPSDPIGGPRGLMASMGVSPPETLITPGSACIMGVYRKIYPTCRHSHSALDAAARIRTLEDFEFSGISKVTINTYKDAIAGHTHKIAKTPEHAMMSMPISIGLMLLDGSVGLDSFGRASLDRKELIELLPRITVLEDARFTRQSPKMRGAKVTLDMKNGRTQSAEVFLPKGEPENPLDPEDLLKKAVPLFEMSGLNYSDASSLANLILDWNNDLKKIKEIFIGNVERILK